MFIILITYRATGVQYFRRDEMIELLENIKEYMKNNDVEYKIIICEQNNNDLFNKGVLYNISFLESEKYFKYFKKYIMINVDYRFNHDFEFPKEYLLNNNGFYDIYTVSEYLPLLGGCCIFDPVSYLLINGFPNNIYGWGGEDMAIFRRIHNRGIHYNRTLLNIGIIKDNSGWNVGDEERNVNNDRDINIINTEKAKNDPIPKNGLDTCYYNIDGYGEFHNGDSIIHLLASFDFK